MWRTCLRSSRMPCGPCNSVRWLRWHATKLHKMLWGEVRNRRGKEGRAMLPEDRLDALLPLYAENGRLQPDQPATTGLNGHDSLQPLLDAADRLTDLADAQPSPEFIA